MIHCGLLFALCFCLCLAQEILKKSKEFDGEHLNGQYLYLPGFAISPASTSKPGWRMVAGRAQVLLSPGQTLKPNAKIFKILEGVEGTFFCPDMVAGLKRYKHWVFGAPEVMFIFTAILVCGSL